MRNRRSRAIRVYAALIISVVISSDALPQSTVENDYLSEKTRLFSLTKFVYVSEKEISDGVTVPDDDYYTVQFIKLVEDGQDRSRVSADGQVIYSRDSDSKDKVLRLLDESFEKRLRDNKDDDR